jgi:protein SSD1
VGIHVVDICYFIKPHSALDKEARSRAVAVSMDQKWIPMLPNELVEVAQFSVGDLKPATSVVYKMSADGSILDTWYGKTVVK